MIVMGVMARFLEGLGGKARFMVLIGKKPAIELFIKNKDIIVEIKNPVLAIDFGLQELLKEKRLDSTVINDIKKLGYNIKIKYKMFELDL